jgi:predicted DNA-binding protein
MRNTITVRLPDEIAEWLKTAASKTGVSQGSIIRSQLEKARSLEERPFLRLAGRVSGDPRLSLRRDFREINESDR